MLNVAGAVYVGNDRVCVKGIEGRCCGPVNVQEVKALVIQRFVRHDTCQSNAKAV